MSGIKLLLGSYLLPNIMDFLKRLFLNLNSKQYSTSKLRERYLLDDYEYLKQAFQRANNYIRIQAVEYLANFNNQENLNFLIEEFKKIKDLKLKSYTYHSILIIAQTNKLKISHLDNLVLQNNINLLSNIGFVNQSKFKNKTQNPISFRDNLKDHLKDLEDKKNSNSGFY